MKTLETLPEEHVSMPEILADVNIRMADDLAENLTYFCENRKTVYTFLARCYEKEIDQAFADAVAADFDLVSDDEVLSREAATLKQELTDVGEARLEQLAVVFNRVFYGMGPRTAQKAFPYESVYTSSGGLMMQNAYNEVKALYAAEGFAKNPDFTEPEDHVAMSFAYMAELCARTLEALDQRDEVAASSVFVKQQNFLKQHLLNWIPSFIADMKGSAEAGFYWHLAAFTEVFLQEDECALAEVLDEQ